MTLGRQTAEDAAFEITNATEMFNVKSQVVAVELTNKRDAFWLVIRVGLCPYNNTNAVQWYQQIGDIRETLYSHLMRLRIPETAIDDEKLRQIGSSLADIWDESRYLPSLRADRKYIIPHLDE